MLSVLEDLGAVDEVVLPGVMGDATEAVLDTVLGFASVDMAEGLLGAEHIKFFEPVRTE